MPAFSAEITQLLLNWKEGDETAFEELIPLVYPELKRLARSHMRRENPGHTLQTSALINEAYLRLVDQQDIQWQDRGHFFAVAATIMRHILTDHARGLCRNKRGAGAPHIPLDEAEGLTLERAAEIIALDDALKTLAAVDARKSQIVELRFFGGLTVEETAEVMSLSPITIKREWRSAKAWLHIEVGNKTAR